MPTKKTDLKTQAGKRGPYIKFTEDFEEFLNQLFDDDPDEYTSDFISKTLTTLQSQFPDEQALFVSRKQAVKKLTRWFTNKRYYLRKKKKTRKVKWEDENKQHNSSDSSTPSESD